MVKVRELRAGSRESKLSRLNSVKKLLTLRTNAVNYCQPLLGRCVYGRTGKSTAGSWEWSLWSEKMQQSNKRYKIHFSCRPVPNVQSSAVP